MGFIAGAGIAIAAGGVIAGGVMSSNKTKKATKKQNKLLKKFLHEERRRNKLVETRTEPFVDVGQRAIKTLSGTATDAERLPSFRDQEFYKFRQDELQRQVKRSSAQKGGLFSGAAIEAEARANMQLSGEETANEKNLLYSLSQMGLGAAIQAGQVGMAGLGAQGNVINQLGTNIFKGTITRGEQQAQAITGSTGMIGGALSNYGMSGGGGGAGGGSGGGGF